ncbi:MAG: DUF1573 domain-containing protein [Bacteroidales bacterium]|nr:DUF1573 domain-containing protein [Bacteroidales bacterium]
MRVLAVIFLFLSLGISSESARAQIRILSREALEAVDSPRLSRDSSSLVLGTRHINAAPMREADPPATFRTEISNAGDSPVDIRRISTTCSCVTASAEKTRLMPGDKTGLTVRYDPKGHLGRFDHKVFIYTMPGNAPAAYLSLSVNVESGSDKSGLYQVQMGGIRLRSSEVLFLAGERAVETLNFINLSGRPLKLECEDMFLPADLKFETRPEVVEDGEEGVMVITYDPSGEMPRKEVPLILKGLGVAPSKATVKIRFE